MIKAGLGYDLHRIESGGELYIGGIAVSNEMHAVAHSDGDALIHSIIDAIVSPVAGLDIGGLYPDSDEAYRGVASTKLLADVKDRFLSGVKIINIDSVVVIDKPKIAGYINQMKEVISSILNLEKENINIKGKTTEKTKIDIIECHTICLLDIE